MGKKRIKKEDETNFLPECGEFLVFKNGKNIFICSYCNKNYETMSLFTAHIKDQHQEKILEFEESDSINTTPFKKLIRNKTYTNPSLKEEDLSTEKQTEFVENMIEPLHKNYNPAIKKDKLLTENEIEGFKCLIIEHESPAKKNSVKLEVKIEHDSEDIKKYGDTEINNKQKCPNFIFSNNEIDQDSNYSENYDNMLQFQISKKLIEKKEKKIKEENDNIDIKTEINESSSEALITTLSENYSKNIDISLSKKKSGWIREKNDIGEWVCQLCGNTYKKGSSLSRHRVLCLKRGGVSIPRRGGINRTKNTNGKYACNHCGEEFSLTLDLSVHEKSHKDEKLKEAKQCEICGKHLHSSSSLREHLLRHTGETPYKCSQCPRGFYNKYTLQTHEKIHLPEKQYPCEQCDKKFSRPPDLRRHVRYVHLNERPAPVMCDLCGKSFTFQFNLKYHMRRHLNVKPVKCDLCDMTFVEKGDLNKHKITHNPDFKPYQCEICSVSFSRKITLTKHQKLHTGLKEYVCKICGKAFAQSPGLYMHMKSHGFNKKPEGAGYYERQSHLMYRNMSSRDTD